MENGRFIHSFFLLWGLRRVYQSPVAVEVANIGSNESPDAIRVTNQTHSTFDITPDRFAGGVCMRHFVTWASGT